MKRSRLFATALLALSTLAFGATTTPPQLISPTGSTAGQAILSNGPSTPPTWGNVALTGVTGTLAIANGGTGATSAANARTNLGLGTAATVNTGTSGATVPLLNGANTWAAAQTFSVRPTFNGATPWDSGNLNFNSPPGIGATTPNVAIFTTLNSTAGSLNGSIGQSTPFAGSFTTVSASSGYTGLTSTTLPYTTGTLGEFFSGSSTGVAMTTATAINCGSISLAAGDWDIVAVINFVPTAALTSIATAANTAVSIPAMQTGQQLVLPFTSGQSQTLSSPVVRIALSSTSTVYAVGVAGFASGTTTCTGYVRARRAH